jgi:hypothetical protein
MNPVRPVNAGTLARLELIPLCPRFRGEAASFFLMLDSMAATQIEWRISYFQTADNSLMADVIL